MVKWDPKYSVKVKEIDDQHKHFMEILNRLYKAIERMETKEEIGEILEALKEYWNLHFKTEEKYFKRFGYEGATEHIEKHREFEAEVTGMMDDFQSDSFNLSVKLVDYLEDWLVNHLITMDQKYVECFVSHGLH